MTYHKEHDLKRGRRTVDNLLKKAPAANKSLVTPVINFIYRIFLRFDLGHQPVIVEESVNPLLILLISAIKVKVILAKAYFFPDSFYKLVSINLL